MTSPTLSPHPQPTTRPTEQPTARDIQRATLRDLANLATDCAATETEIERRYARDIQEQNKQYQRAQSDIAHKFTSLREETRSAQEQAIAEADARIAQETSSLDQADEDARRKVETKHDLVRQEIQKKYDHAVWLADSVYDVACNAAAAEYRKAKERTDEQGKSLTEMEEKAWKLLSTYGWKIPSGFVEQASAGPAPSPEEGATAFESRQEAARRKLGGLQFMILPRLFVGLMPYFLLLIVVVAAGVIVQSTRGSSVLDWRAIGIAAGSSFVGALALGFGLWFLAQKRIGVAYAPFVSEIAAARRAIDAQLELARQQRSAGEAAGEEKRKREVKRAKDKYAPLLNDASSNRAAAIDALDTEYHLKGDEIRQLDRDARGAAESQFHSRSEELDQRQKQEIQRARQQHEQRLRDFKKQYDDARAGLARRLHDGLAALRVPMDGTAQANKQVPIDWNDPNWKDFKPPTRFPSLVRFGELKVDLRQFARAVPQAQPANGNGSHDHSDNGKDDQVVVPPATHLELPPAFAVPAALGFPQQASMLIETDRDGRANALRVLQMVMARLLTSLPPGRVRFTMIDPVGLGESFAGFMHLADYDEALVGARIWTETEQIEKRLNDLTEHMETVIQKYLRNEFQTIDEYNAQAGELAEPYRFLVVSDFPHGFEGDSYRRLASIAASGARCGVYVLILRDTRMPLPHDSSVLDELQRNSVDLCRDGEKFFWNDPVFRQFPLTLDPPPPENMLRKLLDQVGRAAKEAKRVELPFDTIAPAGPQLWSRSCKDELSVPVGRMGATRLQHLRLGRGVAQHALIAGKTGSGKSTLLHALITNLAMWYSPDEVEFYLVDFKKGVEFKTYATHVLPHARAIAVESDREFGISVLQRLDAELTRRGELFRKAGVQDLASYRQTPGAQVMPRTLLIIDEFQEFFSEDDRLAQDASILLDRLVRQGRAFGVHVLLGSQTIGGSSGLARSTMGQMAVRIALQTSEADSQLILGDNNSAARLLSRPGEAIYNDAGGLVEANSPFQVAWLPEDLRETYLQRIADRQKTVQLAPHAAPIVFEGNAAADITKNSKLAAALSSTTFDAPSSGTPAWIGDPVAIKEPSAVQFRRQSGANVLIVGQQEESALGLLSAAMISLAAQQSPGSARFVVFDGSPADSPFAGSFSRIASVLPHETKVIEWRATAGAIDELAQELKRRQDEDLHDAPSIYVILYALQRYRILRKSEDSFSFSSSDEPKAAQSDKQFADLLREGPALGIHILAWADTPAAVDRTLDRGMMREFDNRILFQMSANDSSNLIDSPAANKLGFHRALAYSEEQGVMEKFRPYALPDREWWEKAKALLAAKK